MSCADSLNRPTCCSAIIGISHCCLAGPSAATGPTGGAKRRREAAAAAFAAFPNLGRIASTSRHIDHVDHHRIAARLDTRDRAIQTDEVEVAGIVDRIGAGDAFAAGLIHGLLR